MVILPIFILIGVFVLQISFILGARSYVNHQLYQALICIAQQETPRVCQTQLIRRSQKFLAWGKLKNIQLQQKGEKWIGTLILNIHPWNLHLKQKFHFKEDS